MKKESLLEKFLLSNPFNRGMAEWVILISSGICGLMLSWYNFSIFPITNILGAALIIFAFVFHGHSEKNHEHAHEKTENIKHIVTSGVYSKIRHPLYLSLIILNLGIAFSFWSSHYLNPCSHNQCSLGYDFIF